MGFECFVMKRGLTDKKKKLRCECVVTYVRCCILCSQLFLSFVAWSLLPPVLVCFFFCFFFPMETISSIPYTTTEEALPQKNPREVPPKRSPALRIIGWCRLSLWFEPCVFSALFKFLTCYGTAFLNIKFECYSSFLSDPPAVSKYHPEQECADPKIDDRPHKKIHFDPCFKKIHFDIFGTVSLKQNHLV